MNISAAFKKKRRVRFDALNEEGSYKIGPVCFRLISLNSASLSAHTAIN